MSGKAKPTSSVFLNAVAWVLLALMVAAGVAALFSGASGGTHTIKIAGSEVTTTSVAIVVMFLAAVPLLAVLRYALSGKIRLYERAAEPSWLEDYSGPLQLVAAVLAVAAIVVMLLTWT